MLRRLLPLLFCAAACAGPRGPLVAKAPPPPEIAPAKEAVWVAPGVDLRPQRHRPRLLGRRRNNVGQGERPLLLDRPVAAWAGERLLAVLASEGLHPRPLDPGHHPPVWLEPKVEALSVEVGTADRFDLLLTLDLRRGDRVVRHLSRELHTTRFTGVGGTTLHRVVLLLQQEVDGAWRALLAELAGAPPQRVAVTGRLEVRSSPAGLQVVVDGAPRGTTPLDLDLPPGVHEIRLLHPPDPPLVERLGVVAGRTVRYRAAFPVRGP